jgi:hypothetical protein
MIVHPSVFCNDPASIEKEELSIAFLLVELPNLLDNVCFGGAST